jgi:ParB/RepB/Spo0J family partition protein
MTHIEEQKAAVTATNGVSDAAIDKHDIHRIMQIPLEDLQEHPLNAEIYGDEKPQQDLVESISETGILSPLIANSTNGRIISGNTRFRAARHIGLEKVPVIYKSFSEAAENVNIVTGNVSRSKTNLQRVREYEVLLSAFKKQAKDSTSKKDKGPGKTGEKSRQKAADIVGESPATLQKGVAVVKAADKLRKQGDEEGATRLLDVLNRRRGFDPAEKEAQRLGLIPPSKKKNTGKKGADDVSAPETAESATLESDNQATTAEKVRPKEDGGSTEVSKLTRCLNEASDILQGASDWSAEEKTEVALHFAKLAAAIALAGIGLTGETTHAD